MRWRRRNGARMSKLATRGPVQLEEMRAKAVASVVQGAFRYASPVCRFRFSGRSGATFFQPVDAFRGPIFAPVWRSQNGDRPTFLQEKLRPPGGHEMRTTFCCFFLVFVRSRSRRRTEALASWSWWKYLSSEAERRGQQVLRISLDGDLHEPRACRHEGDTIAMLAGLEP